MLTDEELERSRREYESLKKAGKYKEALALTDEYLRQDVNNPSLIWQRSLLLAKLGRIEEALADKLRLAALTPDRAYPLFFSSQLQIQLGRYAEAIADLDECERRGAEDGYFSTCIPLYRGECWMQLGDYERAVDELEKASDDTYMPGFRKEGPAARYHVFMDIRKKIDDGEIADPALVEQLVRRINAWAEEFEKNYPLEEESPGGEGS